jgi:signal peptidase I
MAHRLRRRSLRAILFFAVVAGVFFYGFRMARVQGRSMWPTFQPGQWLLVRRLNWPAPQLRVGEVIVFRKDGEELVKRIAALPGQRPPADGEIALAITRDVVGNPALQPRGEAGNLSEPVPAGQIYVLGDNPPHSEDSRDFGPIPMNTVLGRVLRWQENKDPAARAHRAQAR